jgi:hypothetical protein
MKALVSTCDSDSRLLARDALLTRDDDHGTEVVA